MKLEQELHEGILNELSEFAREYRQANAEDRKMIDSSAFVFLRLALPQPEIRGKYICHYTRLTAAA